MYIVIRRQKNGTVLGSAVPFQHPTLKAAQVECKRLAALVPGSTFYPMKSLKGFTNKPVEKKYAHVFN